MRAILYKNQDQGFILSDNFERGDSRPDEIDVRVNAAALNKRDEFILQGMYPGITENVILGSDAAGWWKDQRVLINPGLQWGNSQRVQSSDFNILGMPTHGTFSEWVKVPQQNVYPVPTHLDWEQAAALPLAGLTAYRALFARGELKPGQKVLVTGGGGGVALLCIQMAKAIGASVFATTGSEEKRGRLKDFGINGTVNYRELEWDKELKKAHGSFDLIIDSAGGDGLKKLIGLTKPGGNIVIYGGTKGKSDGISPQLIFWRQLNIMGTSMGSDRDFREMLELVEQHGIVPVVDSVYPLEEFGRALERLKSKEHFGKVVIKIHES